MNNRKTLQSFEICDLVANDKNSYGLMYLNLEEHAREDGFSYTIELSYDFKCKDKTNPKRMCRAPSHLFSCCQPKKYRRLKHAEQIFYSFCNLLKEKFKNNMEVI